MTSLQSAPPRHRRPVPPLRIALLGARDLPAGDDAVTAAVEEVGRRLVRHGHVVTAYGAGPASDRATDRGADAQAHAVHRVPVPALGPLGRGALATAHLLAGRRPDVAVVFGAVHAPLIPLLRSRGTAVAVHVDALEWARNRVPGARRRSARAVERLAVREADALITDASTIEDHFGDDIGLPTELIGYGARTVHHVPTDLLEAMRLVPGHFHLAVARSAPEHRIDAIVEGHHRSAARMPLLVLGDQALGGAVGASVRGIAAADDRVRLLGDVRDERLLDQLHAHAASHVHGHVVGAAEPALLRAMGAGTAVLAWDVPQNREVVGTGGSYFTSAAQAARQIEEVERYPFRFRDLGELMQERARKRHDWDVVTEQYEALAARLSRGWSTRGMSTGRRIDPTWTAFPAAVEAHRG